MVTEKEIVVSGKEVLEITEVLNATTLKILKSARNTPINVPALAKNLKTREAYIRKMIRRLEELKLVSTTCERGKRGISKISKSNLEKITIILQ